jgi:hypothetical protein
LDTLTKQAGAFKITAKIEYADWAENPTEWGSFDIHLFKRNNASELLKEFKDNPRALAVGKYEHSEVSYFLSGEGPNCRWDSTPFCGIYVLCEADFESLDKDPVKRQLALKARAREDLETYTDWANGDVYHITVTVQNENAPAENHDTYGAIYGYDAARKSMEQLVEEAASAI